MDWSVENKNMRRIRVYLALIFFNPSNLVPNTIGCRHQKHCIPTYLRSELIDFVHFASNVRTVFMLSLCFNLYPTKESDCGEHKVILNPKRVARQHTR